MSLLRTKIGPLVLATAMLVPFTTSPGPASATDAVSGDAAFAGTAFLPTFPCQPPPPAGNGPCSGSFNGQWTGHLSGVHQSSPFEVSWTTTTATSPAVSASFYYWEVQCLAGTETVIGNAVGTGAATAVPGQVKGNWQQVGVDLPRDILEVSLTFSFQWTRVGTGAVLTLNPATLSLNVAGLGWKTVSTSEQDGTATFVPLTSTGTGVPSCANPLTNVTGAITGDLALR